MITLPMAYERDSMPMQVLTGEIALANLRANPQAYWPDPNDEDNRLNSICRPAIRPSFRIAPKEKIFAVGSCFARHIETALADLGFDIVSKRNSTSIMIRNLYGVPSIYNELSWALEETIFDEKMNFIEVMPGRYIDLQSPSYLRPVAIDEVKKQRDIIREVMARVVECAVVVMTLGLSQCWYDKATGSYLNAAPRKSVVARFPGRFELHVLDHAATLETLRNTIELLRNRSRRDQKVILTVSPVPLLATFTDQDVLVANCESKSLLRVVAGIVSSEYDHVDYFPSYESVTLSDRSVAWQADQHHVNGVLIRENVNRMIAAYVLDEGGGRRSVDDLVIEAREFAQARNFGAALRIMDGIGPSLDQPKDKLLHAELCAKFQRKEQALAILETVPDDEGGWRRKITQARLLCEFGQFQKAIDLVRPLAQGVTATVAFQLWIDILRTSKNFDEAIVVVRRWLNIDNGLEPMRALAEVLRAQEKVEAANAAYRAALDKPLIALAHHQATSLDFAEYLVEQKAFAEARAVLELIGPESKANAERLTTLRLLSA